MKKTPKDTTNQIIVEFDYVPIKKPKPLISINPYSGEFLSTNKMGSINGVNSEKMAKIIGFPSNDTGDEYKVDLQWTCVFYSPKQVENLRFAIWNYKNGPNYTEGKLEISDILDWSFWVEQVIVYKYLQELFKDHGIIELN